MMKITPLVLGLILTASSLYSQLSPVQKDLLYVGHRGASYLAPENTLASIQLAWELGADAAECDVMLTRDNQVILFHDKSTKKLTGENYNVKEASWDQLKKLSIKLRETNLPKYKGEPIPLLENILPTIPEGRMLVIEIKTGPEILPYLKKIVDQSWTSGSISFIAFDIETIFSVKKLYPNVPCYYLSMFKPDLKKHLKDLVDHKLDGVDLRHAIIDQSIMKQCKALGLDVWCWTVNDPETALKMKELGVTALTTDRPAWLKANM